MEKPTYCSVTHILGTQCTKAKAWEGAKQLRSLQTSANADSSHMILRQVLWDSWGGNCELEQKNKIIAVASESDSFMSYCSF